MLPLKRVSRTYISTKQMVWKWEGDLQRPPYDLPTYMTSTFRKVMYDTHGEEDARAAVVPPLSSDFERLQTSVTNKAYERMVGKLGDTSSFGATLTAERRDTWGMIVNTIVRAGGAARNIKRFRFDLAARDLGIPYRERHVVRRYRTGRNRRRKTVRVRTTYMSLPNGRMVQKTMANGWLMWSFGVKPLMQDIYNGMDVLQREFPFNKVRGGATQKSSHVMTWGAANTQYYVRQTYEYKVSVSQSCLVRVSNPNLWLCNRLGLVNPAQWFLEGIPFSFVVDWFSNLSSVVNSMTDFVGLETANPCLNYSHDITWTYFESGNQTRSKKAQKHNIDRGRRLTIVLPKLVFAYERFQWQRGANAISLLIGFLSNTPRQLKLTMRK